MPPCRVTPLSSWALVPVLSAVLVAGCSPTPPEQPVEPTPTPTRQALEPEPLIRCPLSGFHVVVIELAPNTDGVCEARIESADKLPVLTTYRGFDAVWDVCNRCKEPVDVRLRSFLPGLDEIFEHTVPPTSASNEIELTGVQPNGIRPIRGWVRRDAPQTADYEFSWRFSGTLEWTDIDPRLEIEDTHRGMVTRLFRALDGGQPEVR